MKLHLLTYCDITGISLLLQLVSDSIKYEVKTNVIRGCLMGLLDFIKSQFIEVIEWTDSTSDTIVYRFPVEGKEIKMGAQLTVRESQTAVFVNEGMLADIFSPGRYILSTQNMPVLTKLKSWMYGFNSPFKAEVYFVNTKQFIDQKWGTTNPIMMRDTEFGMLRLRGYGNFSFRVVNPVKFLKELFGTNEVFNTENIIGQLKSTIVSGVSDLLGETRIPALDLALNYDELGVQAKTKLGPRFDVYGLQLTSFIIENLSLPEEVEKILDKKTAMGLLGNMQQYIQFQTAEAIQDAAQNQGGGVAGAGVGLGAGIAMGQAMSQALNSVGQQTVATGGAVCPNCKIQATTGSRFCGSCGTPLPAGAKCIKCGQSITTDSKFCCHCGAPQSVHRICKKCGRESSPEAIFCTVCGSKVE